MDIITLIQTAVSIRVSHQMLATLRRTMSTTSQKPIFLYTAGTANGKQVSILLEELKAVYGSNKIDYESVLVQSYHLIYTNSYRK